MKLIKIFFLMGLCLVLLMVAGFAKAQSGDGFEITTYTIDDGGRYSTGDGIWLGGTIGQLDSGVHTGGAFELSGGFWVEGILSIIEYIICQLIQQKGTRARTPPLLSSWTLIPGK